MNICLLSSEYLSTVAQGGIGAYTYHLAHALGDLGHEVTVLTPCEEAEWNRSPEVPSGPLSEPMESGIRMFRLRVPPRLRIPLGNRYLGMTLASLPFMGAVGRKIQELSAIKPFDVIESPEWMAPGLQYAMRSQTPLVVRLHSHVQLVRRLNGLPMNLDARMLARLENLLLQRASVILANSQSLAQECARDHRIPPDRIQVLPLGLDYQLFAPRQGDALRQRLGLPATVSVVLYAGRLEQRKGVDLLIEAFGQVATQHPAAVLALAGFDTQTAPGQRSYRDFLEQRVAALGIAGNVHFLGHVPYAELPELYASCDIFVAPSRFEPFGMIYLEAMASAKPVIACRSGGVPEIVEEGSTGLMVEPEDADGLARALARLLADPTYARKLGEAGRNRVKTLFSSRTIAERTTHFYRSACGHGNGVPLPEVSSRAVVRPWFGLH